MDLSLLLKRSIHENPHRTAVRTPLRQLTYGELGERAAKLANAISSLGIQPGDRVGILLTNRMEYVEIDVALALGGYVRVPLNFRLTTTDFAHVIDAASVRLLITEDTFDEATTKLLELFDLKCLRMGDDDAVDAFNYETFLANASWRAPAAQNREGQVAWLQYTSGTTGRPKGVMLSHRALAHVAYNLLMELPKIVPGKSNILLPQPLSHGAGYFVLPYLISGGTVNIVDRFDPEEIVYEGRRHSIDTLKLVPTMLLDLPPSDLPFVNIIYGAAPLARSPLEEIIAQFDGSLMQIYGQTECPVTITRLAPHDHVAGNPRLQSAGQAWRTVQIEVRDENNTPSPPGDRGEVFVRGPHRMEGYYNQPELTLQVLQDGWIRTSDIGYLDDRGYLYLEGRRDEMINSGGFNIAPKEVEEVVFRHPSVKDCVVAGVPDDRWGQAVNLYVELRHGHDVDPSEFLEFTRESLGFRRPRSVYIVSHIPRNAYGKPDRRAVQHLDSIAVAKRLP